MEPYLFFVGLYVALALVLTTGALIGAILEWVGAKVRGES